MKTRVREFFVVLQLHERHLLTTVMELIYLLHHGAIIATHTLQLTAPRGTGGGHPPTLSLTV